MFFLTLLICFVAIGSCMTVIDFVMPNFFIPFVAMGIKFLGIILIWCGVLLYVGRAKSTGAGYFIDLPNPNKTILLLVGNSGARFLSTTKGELNSLIAKGKHRMRLKDMGFSNYIAGHELQVACQTVNVTLPIPVLDAVNKWRKRWHSRNKEEFLDLSKQLKDIKSYADVEKITMLKPLMENPETRKYIFDLSLDDIRNMRELLYDGQTIDIKSYLDWDETANPYDNESIINRVLAHRAEQRTSYRMGAAGDWAKIVIPVVILFIGGAIAYQLFMT